MSEFDDNASQEERIEYLRARGIQIEIPGERKAPESSKPIPSRPVTVVKVPCNESLDLHEVTVNVDDTRGDMLLHGLMTFFSDGSNNFDMAKLKASLQEQHGNQDVEISEDALVRASAMGNVETFPIDHPSPDTNMRGVNIYLDEASQLKSLPPNKRATALAETCGFKGVPFSGDVYLGRVSLTKSGIIGNEDFYLADLDTTSDSGQWLKGAETRNYRHNSELGKIEMNDTSSDPKVGDNAELGISFTESIDTMDVEYALPDAVADLTRANKQLSVKFNQQHLRIFTLGDDAKLLLDVPLYGKVEVDGCTWTAAGPRTIEICMEKAEEAIWGQVEA
jgi:hypothetical protein